MAKIGSSWLTRIVRDVDRDPEIDRFQSLFNKDRLKENDLAMLGGLSVSTVKNMFSAGKTRRPQHMTFSKIAGAMGFRYDLVRDDKPDYEAEIPKARDEFKSYKGALRKKRERDARKGK
jgi:hypothetical protein